MLFVKECKKTIMSFTYLIFVVILLLFAYTEIGPNLEHLDPISPPQQGLESYGSKYEDNIELITRNATETLLGEYESASYTAYPLGFYKNVRLSEQEQEEMARILSELTGMSDEVLRERFYELMKQVDKIIGGGSKYSQASLAEFGNVPKTYEDAVADYQAIVEQDKVTGALARLFCDYLGIIVSLFPVFVAVALGLKDRRAQLQDLIYTRGIMSFRIVLSRYSAMVAAMFLPVLLLAVLATVQALKQYKGMEIDSLAFITYSCGWLLPSIMMSTAVGVFLTELTDTPIAIAVHGLWWFIGINKGLQHIEGGYGSDLAIRHNIVGNTEIYLDNLRLLTMNRISYVLLAIALVAVSVWIYEWKRRGKLDVCSWIKKIFVHRSIQSST